MYVCTSSVMICMEWMRVVWLCICVQVKNWMEQAIKTRLSATEKEKGRVYLPRVVRVAQQFKLTEVETEILYYSLIEQCWSLGVSSELGLRTNFGNDVTYICGLLDVSIIDMLDFLNSERIHMQQVSMFGNMVYPLCCWDEMLSAFVAAYSRDSFLT